LFKAGAYDSPVPYNGGRAIKDWVDFLNKEIPAPSTDAGASRTDL